MNATHVLSSQDRLQIGYVGFTNTMRWFHKRATELEYEEYGQMLKMVDFALLMIAFALLIHLF